MPFVVTLTAVCLSLPLSIFRSFRHILCILLRVNTILGKLYTKRSYTFSDPARNIILMGLKNVDVKVMQMLTNING